MENEIKDGDVVTLKSGGPKMTVSASGTHTMGVDFPDNIVCVWFDGSKQQEHTFQRAVLKHA